MATKGSWKNEFKKLWIEDKKKRYPNFYAEGAEDYFQIPKTKTANGLTQAIVKFLSLKGHYANRISTQGQARVHKIPKYNILSGQLEHRESVRYTHGNTKLGTPDITAIIGGHSIWIEVKIGRDKMSDEQWKQKEQIEKARGIYYIARDMQAFYDWYYDTFPDPDLYTTVEGY